MRWIFIEFYVFIVYLLLLFFIVDIKPVCGFIYLNRFSLFIPLKIRFRIDINDQLSNGKWHFPWIQRLSSNKFYIYIYTCVNYVCLCQLASIHIVQCLSIKLYQILTQQPHRSETHEARWRQIQQKKKQKKPIGRPDDKFFHTMHNWQTIQQYIDMFLFCLVCVFGIMYRLFIIQVH